MGTIDFRAIRPYLPGALLLGFAAVLAFVLQPLAGSLRASPYLAQFAPFTAAVAPLATAGGLLHWGWVTLLLWRADHGRGLLCDACGGPLGAERAGRANRGGRYRKCLCCGRNANHRYYDYL